MQITSRFTIAVHVITCVALFQETEKVTSQFLAGSVGANPVIIRNVMSQLREAGILSISQGRTGITLNRPLEQITFYDVYKAVDCVDMDGLFHFHENPNAACPVGRNIHRAMDGRLADIQSAMEARMKQLTLADAVADTRAAIEREAEGKDSI